MNIYILALKLCSVTASFAFRVVRECTNLLSHILGERYSNVKKQRTTHTDRGLCRFRAFLPKNVYVYDYVCATIILWLFANGLHKIVCSLWRLGITDTCMHTQIRTNMFNGFATHVQSIPTPHTTRVRCSSAHSSVFVAALATATAAALLHHIHYNLKLLWLCGRPHVGRS